MQEMGSSGNAVFAQLLKMYTSSVEGHLFLYPLCRLAAMLTCVLCAWPVLKNNEGPGQTPLLHKGMISIEQIIISGLTLGQSQMLIGVFHSGGARGTLT